MKAAQSIAAKPASENDDGKWAKTERTLNTDVPKQTETHTHSIPCPLSHTAFDRGCYKAMRERETSCALIF